MKKIKLHTTLKNGVKIYLCPEISNIILCFNNVGFELDYLFNLSGISHLFEHLCFENTFFDNINAFTDSSRMCFYTYNYDNTSLEFQLYKIISLFYINNIPKFETKDFYNIIGNCLDKRRSELENEYYYRTHGIGVTFPMERIFYNLPLYPGGKFSDFESLEKVIKALYNFWCNINPQNIIFILPSINKELLLKIKNSFGTKKQTYFIKKTLKIKLPKQISKQEYLTLSSFNLDYYVLVFRIFKDELNRFLENISIAINDFNLIPTTLLTNYGDDYFFHIGHFENLNHVKNFIYQLKSLSEDNLILKTYNYDFNDITSILEYLLFYDIYYNRVKNLVLRDKKRRILELCNFLYKKFLNYGTFFLYIPNNSLLSNSKDIYNDSYFISQAYLNELDNTNFLIEIDDDYYYKKNNLNNNILCVFDKKYEFNYLSDNYYLLEISNYDLAMKMIGYLPIKYLGFQNNSFYFKTKNNTLIDNIVNLNIYSNFYDKKFDRINFNREMSLDNLGQCILNYIFNLRYFDILDMFNTNNVNTNPIKKTCIFKKIKIQNKCIDIITPFSFLITIFQYKDKEYFIGKTLSYYIKNEGLIYCFNIYYDNRTHSCFLFMPTLEHDKCIKYIKTFINSFGERNVLFIKSKLNNYYNFDNFYQYFNTLEINT